MATTPPPALTMPSRPAADVFKPLNGGINSLGAWLQYSHTEGRRIVTGERFRWQRNREAYRGNTYLQPNAVNGSLRRLAPADMLTSGRRRDSINLLRRFVDGRGSMIAQEKPAYDVIPSGRERAQVDAARLATRLVDFEWSNVDGWNIASHGRQLELVAAQDGLAFSNVIYDRSRGEVCGEMFVPTEQGWAPISQVIPDEGELRKQVEALQEADPKGERLWRNEFYPKGEVVLRVVRASAMAFDPNMTTDWRDCGWVIESRKVKIADVEREAGRPLREMMKSSAEVMGQGRTRTAPRTGGSAEADDGSGEKRIDPEREVFLHRLFAKATGPSGEFPNGAHVMWVQDAPAAPLVVEPWLWPDGTPRDLPYFPYIPRPDGGHLLRTLGTVDELLPVQRQFDRRVSQYGEYLDLCARPPLLLVGGSLKSKSVFNADRVVHVNPGFEPPRWLTVPPDPGIAILQNLGWLESKMAEIAMQSDPVRGQAPPGIEAAAALNTLIAQGESQLAGSEAQWKMVIERTVGEALRNVIHFYGIERKIQMPGVDDQAEFEAFTGAMLKGADRFRISGSVLPKNKAVQEQRLIQFMQYAGPRFDPTPFAAQILQGDVEGIVSMEKAQGRKQERENNDLAALGALEQVDRIWQAFTAMRDRYVQLMAALARKMQAESQAAGVAPAMNPQQVWQAMGGPPPPRVLDLLRSSGFRVPTVAVTDRHHMHIRSLEFFMTNDGFDAHHELVRQAAQEHLMEHVEAQTRQAASISMQSPQMAMATPGAQPPSAPPPSQE